MRLLIIDDHTLFRSGLAELLERRGIDIAAAVGDGEQGLELAATLAPDLILLDLRMPGMGGVEVLSALRARVPTVPVVMLTTSTEEKDLLASLRRGASGYLLKDIEPSALIESLTQVLTGKTVVSPQMTEVLAKAVQGQALDASQPDRFAQLTPREMEILCHLAEGLSNKMIAARLGISAGTVKLHVRAILKKLQLRSRVEAAVLAVEQNICPGRS